MAIFTSNEAVDTLAKPMEISKNYLPKYIASNIESIVAKHVKGEIKRVFAFKEAMYQVDDKTGAFVASTILIKPRRNIDFIGVYRNNNFDFLTEIYDVADSSATSSNTVISKIEITNKEYKITYITNMNNISKCSRASFKDTVGQLLWYKLEDGRLLNR